MSDVRENFIPLIVSETEGDDLNGDDPFEEHGFVRKFLQRRTTVENVKAADLSQRLDQLQEQLEPVIARLAEGKPKRRLTELTVGLAVSGSGSVGIATVGAEVSITLTYAL